MWIYFRTVQKWANSSQSKSGELTNLLPWSRKISDLEQTQPLGFCYDLITSYKLISGSQGL